MKEELEARVNRAVDYFMQGYGCCQSVVAAFADIYGLDEKLALKIAAGFGGGVGKMRMMCGAVSGLVMLIGLEEGQTEGADNEGKSHCYKIVQQLLEESKQQNGSIICAEILGLKGYEKAANSMWLRSARQNTTRSVLVRQRWKVLQEYSPTIWRRKVKRLKP